MSKYQKVAIVYDWIDKWGGVERVLLTLHEMFPKADFISSYYDKKNASWARTLKIKTSFINNLPSFIKTNRLLSLPLYPYAFESFDLREYDLVISVTSLFAKSVITRPGTTHVCYLLTPPRYLWNATEAYISNSFMRAITSPLVSCLREYDYIAAQRPDKIISISQAVADRCKKVYGRESEVIYPPFDIAYWSKIKKSLKSNKQKKEPYFLVVGRLEQYKKIDIAIEVCNKLKKKLIVVGKGSQLSRLQSTAGETISFLSDITDRELGQLYSHADALIMPQEEDFGYVSLEAQFFGCPVIAYDRGGAKETMIDGKTGILFHEQTSDSLTKALARFHTMSYNNNSLEHFSKQNFIEEFTKHL